MSCRVSIDGQQVGVVDFNAADSGEPFIVLEKPVLTEQRAQDLTLILRCLGRSARAVSQVFPTAAGVYVIEALP